MGFISCLSSKTNHKHGLTLDRLTIVIYDGNRKLDASWVPYFSLLCTMRIRGPSIIHSSAVGLVACELCDFFLVTTASGLLLATMCSSSAFSCHCRLIRNTHRGSCLPSSTGPCTSPQHRTLPCKFSSIPFSLGSTHPVQQSLPSKIQAAC